MQQINLHGQPRELIHFVYTQGDERIACMPNMTEFHQTPYHPHVLRSNDVRAVNCSACVKTDQFKQAKQSLEAALRSKES